MPQLLIITGRVCSSANAVSSGYVILFKNSSSYRYFTGSGGAAYSYGGTITNWGTTVSWYATYISSSYSTYGQFNQMNGSDCQYNYIAFARSDEVDQEAEAISFAINGTAYNAMTGMTWDEWVNSSYNTAGYVRNGDVVVDISGNNVITLTADAYDYAYPDMVIRSGYNYAYSYWM